MKEYAPYVGSLYQKKVRRKKKRRMKCSNGGERKGAEYKNRLKEGKERKERKMKQNTKERNGCSPFSLSFYSLCVSISFSFHSFFLSFFSSVHSNIQRRHIEYISIVMCVKAFFSHFSFIPSLSFFSSHLPLFSFLSSLSSHSFQQMLPKGYTHS